jgi:hypothetical protein
VALEDPQFKEQFHLILEEAEANYSTSRFMDAGKAFEHLAQLCIDNKLHEDMVYFFYRAIVSWVQSNQALNVIKGYQKLAVTCLKLSTLKVFAEIESSVDLVEKAELLRLAQQNLRYLNEDEKRSQILSTLIEIYEKFGNDTSLDYNEKVKFIERAVNLSYEMDDTARTTTLKLQLAKITEIQAQQVLSEKSFDSELVAAHLYIKAAKIYLEIGFDTNYTELFSKAVDLYPDLDLEDLQISTVGS